MYKEPSADKAIESGSSSDLRPGVGDVSPELRDIANIPHSDRKVLSIIDMKMWDRADWQGLGFGIDPTNSLPFISFLFRDKDEGCNVSLYLQQKLGREDTEEKMRISIITGIDSNNPAAYRI